MGCGGACPIYAGRRYMDWPVADPIGQPLDVRGRRRGDRVVGDIAQPCRPAGSDRSAMIMPAMASWAGRRVRTPRPKASPPMSQSASHARLYADGRDRCSALCCLGVARSMRSGGCGNESGIDAEGGAARGVRPALANAGERIGCREPFRSRSKIIMVSTGMARRYWSLSGCPQVRAAIAEFRSFRTIQMYRRSSRGRSHRSER
jgi:hypothetical protein